MGLSGTTLWDYDLAESHPCRPRAAACKEENRLSWLTDAAKGIKALANKLARATFYLLRDQTSFEEEKLFG